jgi:DNA-binding IclR family transcriptional regulator
MLQFMTSHAVLATLTATGYVVRHDQRKTYELGPALVAVGEVALKQHRAVEMAREELPAMADGFQLESLVSIVTGTDMLILARSGRQGALEQLPRVGERLRHAPPIGMLWVAWAGDEALKRWLDSYGPALGPDERAALDRLVNATRLRGYEIVLEAVTRRPFGSLLAAAARSSRDGLPIEAVRQLIQAFPRETSDLLTIDPAATYEVSMIAAPVFDSKGRVALSLQLLGFDRPLTGQELRNHLGALLESARYITLTTKGTMPERAGPGLMV